MSMCSLFGFTLWRWAKVLFLCLEYANCKYTQLLNCWELYDYYDWCHSCMYLSLMHTEEQKLTNMIKSLVWQKLPLVRKSVSCFNRELHSAVAQKRVQQLLSAINSDPVLWSVRTSCHVTVVFCIYSSSVIKRCQTKRNCGEFKILLKCSWKDKCFLTMYTKICLSFWCLIVWRV